MFRWFALVVFAATLAVSASLRRRARRAGGTISRGSEPAPLIAGRIVVALPLFGAVIAHLARPEWMGWATISIPVWARWIGVALGILVVPSAYRVLATLGANVSETVLTKPEQRLVTTGPYRLVRHPLYTVGIALFLSVGLMLASWFVLAFALIALAGIRFVVIPREEAGLEARFGDAYRRYRDSTGALLPIRRASAPGGTSA